MSVKDKSSDKPLTAADKARKEYYRNWRAQNKQKIKEYNKRYWERKANELKGAANNG